jgi:aldehyde:ferredoxin oxidoreductase
VSGETFGGKYLSQHTACAHCQCGCIHLATLREEYKPWHYATSKVSYDYELIFALGSVLSLSCPEDILRLILMVEREGWDAISMGVTLAWATEAYLNGVIGDKETDGLPISFGDAECYLEMMRRCAAGKGEFFRDLEQGCAKCSAKWGGEDFAIHYGGVEPAGYMTGENFALSSLLGVRHSHLDDIGYSLDQKLLNKLQPVEEQVAQQVREAQWRMILNSLAVCLFARGIYDREIILEGLSALSLDWTSEKLDALGKLALRRKHEWRKLCGCDIANLRAPAKMFRVRSATGHMDDASIYERVKLYREQAEV